MKIGSTVTYISGDDLPEYGARYSGEDRGLKFGLYTVVNTDAYEICGMVEIENAEGIRWGINARLLQPFEVSTLSAW